MFSPGDRVHLAGLGTGIVREVRSGARYAIEIKGRIVIASGRDLHRAADAGKTRKRAHDAQVPAADAGRRAQAVLSIDLHGKTVDEALAAVESFVSGALIEGHHEVQIIHGRSGGRLKTAVHRYLRQLSVVAAFRIDPANPGVTIAAFK
jgi:DNA mismatch repair protein MutS2